MLGADIPAPLFPQTAGGILLPYSQKKTTREGEVVAVGPGALLKDGSRAAVSLSVGDMVRITHLVSLCAAWFAPYCALSLPQVLLPEYGGTKVDLQEDGTDEFVLYRDDDILGVFER